MKLVKIGNKYCNLDFLIVAEVFDKKPNAPGYVTLTFSDGKHTKTLLENWTNLLFDLEITVPEVD